MTRSLISSIYKRGDESAAYYKRQRSDRSSNWAHVPKNAKVKATKPKHINVAQHEWEVKHGYAPLLTRLEDFK